MEKKEKWMVTVAKSGVIEIEASTEQEAYKVTENTNLSHMIQWEDSWNVVDIDKLSPVEM